MHSNLILLPMLTLGLWTMLVFFWMYATRIPAMTKAKLDPQDARHPGSLSSLPNPARQIADNYNHLFEQPTLFYAVVLAAWAIGDVGTFTLATAWGYALIRVLHSLIQNTYNKVMLRFPVFALGSLFLVGLLIDVFLSALSTAPA